MLAARAYLVAARDWVPGGFGPFYGAALGHWCGIFVTGFAQVGVKRSLPLIVGGYYGGPASDIVIVCRNE